ncbi:unnamed protein product [Parajaminaea phylloscopi]
MQLARAGAVRIASRFVPSGRREHFAAAAALTDKAPSCIDFFSSQRHTFLVYSLSLDTTTMALARASASSATRLVRAAVATPFRASSTSSSPPPPPPSSSSPSSTPRPPPPADDTTTHFGFQDVPSSLKESLVGGVFSSVSSSYDVMNDAMSMGIHRLWKNHFVSTVLDPRGGIQVLDVAGGTGDIAMRILDHARTQHADRTTSVKMLDINADMLREGMVRFKKESMYWDTPQLDFQLANAQSLSEKMVVPEPTKASHKRLPQLHSRPIADESVDLYTIAFGIRNCTRIDEVLREAYRVLKPGGVFACLEFGKVTNPYFAEVYRQYSFRVLPQLGHILASDSASYQYLVESIEKFPSQADFAQMVKEAGFTMPSAGGVGSDRIRDAGLGAETWAGNEKEWEDLTGGIATIWVGVKL